MMREARRASASRSRWRQVLVYKYLSLTVLTSKRPGVGDALSAVEAYVELEQSFDGQTAIRLYLDDGLERSTGSVDPAHVEIVASPMSSELTER